MYYDDDNINAAGGVHIIQTFVSEDISEEIQIQGRTASQIEKKINFDVK